MQAVIFRIVPTALEISLVCGILVREQSSKERIIWNLWYLVCARRTNLAGILLPSPPGHSLLTHGSRFAQLHGGMISAIFDDSRLTSWFLVHNFDEKPTRQTTRQQLWL